MAQLDRCSCGWWKYAAEEKCITCRVKAESAAYLRGAAGKE